MKNSLSMFQLTIILHGIIVVLLFFAMGNTCSAQTPATAPQKSATLVPLPAKEQVAAEKVQQRQIEEQKLQDETKIRKESIQLHRECIEAIPLKAVEKIEMKIAPVENQDNKINNPKSPKKQ